MSVTVRITVEDIAAVLATYNRIQLERATAVDGAYSLIQTITLVAGTYYYSYEDATGTVNHWYRYRYHHSSGGPSSDYSNPFRPAGVTRLKIRQHLINTYRAGLVFTTDAAGTATTVSTANYRVKSSSYRSNRGRNSYLYAASGVEIGKTRIVTGSDPINGDFTVDAFDAALGSGIEVEWHWLADPDAINESINRGLSRYYYVDRVPIVGVTGQVEYNLSFLPWLTKKNQITGLWHFPVAGQSEVPWNTYGQWFDLREDQESIYLMIYPAIDPSRTVYLEGYRALQPLYTDTSVLPIQVDLDLCAALAYDELLKTLLQPGQMGSTEDRRAWRQALQDLHPELIGLLRKNAPKPRFVPTRTLTPPTVPRPARAR